METVWKRRHLVKCVSIELSTVTLESSESMFQMQYICDFCYKVKPIIKSYRNTLHALTLFIYCVLIKLDICKKTSKAGSSLSICFIIEFLYGFCFHIFLQRLHTQRNLTIICIEYLGFYLVSHMNYF